MPIEFRHIRYFLAVAEEQNFTRAAARLGIAQPPLSQQIKDLEKQVGVSLFHRQPQGAVLSEAGQAFHERVRHLSSQLEGAVGEARRVGAGELGTLTLGVTGTVVFHPLILAALQLYRQQYQQIELQLLEGNSTVLQEALYGGRIEVALLRSTDNLREEFAVEPLLRESMLVALPGHHRLATRRGRVQALELKDDGFIVSTVTAADSIQQSIERYCQAAGFSPQVVQRAPQVASILSLVAAGLGVTMLPESARQLAVKGVVFRTLQKPEPTVDLALARRRDLSPAARNFIQILRAEASLPPLEFSP